MVFKKIIFQNRYVELPPLHGKSHLKFPFWFLNPSLINLINDLQWPPLRSTDLHWPPMSSNDPQLPISGYFWLFFGYFWLFLIISDKKIKKGKKTKIHRDMTEWTKQASDWSKSAFNGKGGVVGHQNFWSIVLDDHWSKKIYRPKTIFLSGATFISDDLFNNSFCPFPV